MLKVRLYRPFAVERFVAALPPTRRSRSPCSTAPRSPAASGEPLYLDVVTALHEVEAGAVRRRA